MVSPGVVKTFTEDFNQYLLKIDPKKNELILMKRGVWTWIKIHIGSLFHLFDKSTIQLKKIQEFVTSNIKVRNADHNYTFRNIIDYKIRKHNQKYKKNKIPEILSNNFEYFITNPELRKHLKGPAYKVGEFFKAKNNLSQFCSYGTETKEGEERIKLNFRSSRLTLARNETNTKLFEPVSGDQLVNELFYGPNIRKQNSELAKIAAQRFEILSITLTATQGEEMEISVELL